MSSNNTSKSCHFQREHMSIWNASQPRQDQTASTNSCSSVLCNVMSGHVRTTTLVVQARSRDRWSFLRDVISTERCPTTSSPGSYHRPASQGLGRCTTAGRNARRVKPRAGTRAPDARSVCASLPGTSPPSCAWRYSMKNSWLKSQEEILGRERHVRRDLDW